MIIDNTKETQVDEFFDELVKYNKLLYLTRKAERGDIRSMVLLMDMYIKGDSVEKNLEKAIEWHNKAKETLKKYGFYYDTEILNEES